MSDDDRAMIVGQVMPLRDKLLIVGMILVVAFALLLPVCMAAQNRQMVLEDRSMGKLQVVAEEQYRALSAEIATLLMPEQALAEAESRSLGIEKLSFDQIRLVVLEEQP